MARNATAYINKKLEPAQRSIRITYDKPEEGVSAEAIRFQVAHPDISYLTEIANQGQFMRIIRGYHISTFREIGEYRGSFVLTVDIPKREGLAFAVYRHLSDYFSTQIDQSAESNQPASILPPVIYIDHPVSYDKDFIEWARLIKRKKSVKVKDQKAYRWTYSDQSTIHLWYDVEEESDHVEMMKLWEKRYATHVEENDDPEENPHLAVISVQRDGRGNLIPARSPVYVLSRSLSEEAIRDFIFSVPGLHDNDRDALKIGESSLRFDFIYRFE